MLSPARDATRPTLIAGLNPRESAGLVFCVPWLMPLALDLTSGAEATYATTPQRFLDATIGFGFRGIGNTSVIQTFPFQSRFNTPTFTISAWVTAFSAGSNRSALSKAIQGFGITDGSWVLGQDATTNWRIAIVVGATQFNANAAQTLNVLTHLCATYDGNTLALYVNGKVGGTASPGGAFAALTQDITLLGRGSGATVGTSWDGAVYESRIYNRCFSADEVTDRLYLQENRWKLYLQPTSQSYRVPPAATFNPAWARGANIFHGGYAA